jgi:hypothetical protein
MWRWHRHRKGDGQKDLGIGRSLLMVVVDRQEQGGRGSSVLVKVFDVIEVG